MLMSVASGWLETNQRCLSGALAVVRAHLSCHGNRSKDVETQAESARQLETAKQEYRELARTTSPPPAIHTLSSLFGLSPFERDLLLMCAGLELDATFAPLCAALRGDPQHAYPTFSLALAALPQAHWSALTPSAPLRYWKLIELGGGLRSGGPLLTTCPLRIDERVLHYLTGVKQLDDRLAGLVEPPCAPQTLMPAHQSIVHRAVAAWSGLDKGSLPAIVLYGPDASSARDIAKAVCTELGLNLQILPARSLPQNPSDLVNLIRLWEREGALSSSALLLDCGDDGLADASREANASDFVERMPGALLLYGRERRAFRRRATTCFEVSRPAALEQRAVWNVALGESARHLDGQLDVLTSQFNLSVPAIISAATQAKVGADGLPSFDALWEACRAQSRSQLHELAQPIESTATWSDLVLPELQQETLRDIVAHVRHRAKVYEKWGFAAKGTRGLGITALFSGASGTGKTMAAEVLSGELRLDLYRIDLSSVVSKYIGETEKNLRRVFDAAEMSGAILLFDEADALFGKRSEVKDSHDRYANIEVGYLLQRMECYRGLAILTTNMKSALDAAFLRRIRFVVQFPFPDAAQRTEIWRRIFPASTPTDGLDSTKLAQLNVAGGNIRNMALNAAFLAADSHEPVNMSHLLRAARSEYAKLEKSLTTTEIAGWL